MIAWHAVGPALVLGLAGEGPPKLSDWPIYVLALLSQFAYRFYNIVCYSVLFFYRFGITSIYFLF